jgi:hypothetical protein
MPVTDRTPALYEDDPAVPAPAGSDPPEYRPEDDEDPRDYIWYSAHYLKEAS